MKIDLNKKYVSELHASTELHAGGLFFCIIYRDCLQFLENGKVVLTKRVIDAFRPMDQQDIKHIDNFKIEGVYYYNDRGYLTCKFDELFVEYVGLISEGNLLPFHIYDSRLSERWSEIYHLENES